MTRSGVDDLDAVRRGVLLVEFIPDCRCTKYWLSMDFPYIQGHLKAARIPTDWVYLERTAQYCGGLDLLGPEPAHTDTLVAAAEERGVAVLVFNHTCDAAFVTALRARLPNRWLVVSDDRHEMGRQVSRFYSALQILSGEPSTGPEDPLFLRTAVPDYASSNLLAAAPLFLPQVELAAGCPSCRHFVPLARNPNFSDLDMTSVRQTIGCSFCLSVIRQDKTLDRAGTMPDREEQLATMERELRRFKETAPLERRNAVFSCQDPRVFPVVLEEVVRLALDPATFYFVRRLDEILRAEEVLRRTLPALATAGHRIVFDCAGIENFSPPENRRFNKCVTNDELVRCLTMLHELETEWPETLWFFRGNEKIQGANAEASGIMMILFTPWTEMDDLRKNVEMLEQLGAIIPALANIRHQLTSRLKLLPGAAVTRLAEQDGLLTEVFPEPVGAAEVGDMRSEEIAWRFADPDVARVYRLALRVRNGPLLQPNRPLPHEDVLQAGVLPLRALIFEGGAPFLRIFRLIVEEVANAPAEASDAEVLKIVAEKAAARSEHRG